MLYLAVATVLVGLLCVLDLVLTLGVIRRLREHTELLSKQNTNDFRPNLTVGGEVGEFVTSTVDGERLTRHALLGGAPDQTLVGFFSPSCRPCEEKLPKFVDFARAMPGGRSRVLAVVVGEPDESATLVAELGEVARVVLEGYDGPLGSAFRVKGYPAALLVAPDRDGRAVVVDDGVALDRPLATVA
jgi:hypothetical protein